MVMEISKCQVLSPIESMTTIEKKKRRRALNYSLEVTLLHHVFLFYRGEIFPTSSYDIDMYWSNNKASAIPVLFSGKHFSPPMLLK